MAFAQFLALCLIVAAVTAYPSGSQSDIHHSQDKHSHKFGYNIADHHTGDNHGRSEHGQGGHHVAGNYYLKDPHGYERHVEYVADGHAGTHQVVKGSPYGLYVHTPFYSIIPKGHGGGGKY